MEDLWRDLDRLARQGARKTGIFLDPGAWAVATYRTGRALQKLPSPLRLPLAALHVPWERLVRAVTGVRLPSSAEIGGGLFLPHPGDVAVADGAHLGRDCNLSRGVALVRQDRGAPWIGDRVYVGPGARIVGPVRIGNDVAIGAHAVVTDDVPDGGEIGMPPGTTVHFAPGRRPPPMADQIRGFLRAVLPRPTQLLLRQG